METKEKKEVTTQGVETKKTKISRTYTLTQFGEMIKKIEELGWLEDEELKQLKGLREVCKNEYVKGL